MLVNHKVSARGNLAPTFLLTYFWRSGYRASVTSFHSASGSTAKVTATASDRNWTSFSFLLFCFDSDLFRVMRSRRHGSVCSVHACFDLVTAFLTMRLSHYDFIIRKVIGSVYCCSVVVYQQVPRFVYIFCSLVLFFRGFWVYLSHFFFFLYNKCIILWLPH